MAASSKSFEFFDKTKVKDFLNNEELWGSYTGSITTEDIKKDTALLHKNIEKLLKLEDSFVNEFMASIRLKALGQIVGIVGYAIEASEFPQKTIQVMSETTGKSYPYKVPDFNNHEIAQFAGWYQCEYLLYNFYFLLECYLSIKKNKLACKFDMDQKEIAVLFEEAKKTQKYISIEELQEALRKEIILLVLESEIRVVLNSYKIRKECQSLLESKDVDKIKSDLKSWVFSFVNVVLLSDDYEICIPGGSKEHALYITLIFLKNSKQIIIRIDDSNKNETTILGCINTSKKNEVLTLIDYLADALEQLNEADHDIAREKIINKKAFNLSKNVMNNYVPLEMQKALDCVVEGYRRGMWYRLWRKFNTTDDSLYKWLVNQSKEFAAIPHSEPLDIYKQHLQLRDQDDQKDFKFKAQQITLLLAKNKLPPHTGMDSKHTKKLEEKVQTSQVLEIIERPDFFSKIMRMSTESPSSNTTSPRAENDVKLITSPNEIKGNLNSTIEKPVQVFIDRSIKKQDKLINANKEIKSILENKSAPIVILHGSSGTGKTQIALGFAHNNCLHYQNKLLQFDVESEETYHASLRNNAKILNIVSTNVTIENVEEAIIDKIISESNYLLLFDNLNDKKIKSKILDKIKRLIKNNHVIITTILTDWDAEEWGSNKLKVDEYSESEAKQFILLSLQEELSRNQDKNEATKAILALIKTVGRLPLALAQAVGYLRKSPGIKLYIKQYIENITNKKRLLDNKEYFQGNPHKKSIFNTFVATITNLDNESKEAGDLIRLLAFFDANNISQVDFLSPLLKKDITEITKAVRNIREYSLINQDGVEGNIFIHRLLQEIIIIYSKDENKFNSIVIDLVRCCKSFFDYDYAKIDTYDRAKLNLVHVKKLANHAKDIKECKADAYYLLERSAICEFEILGISSYVINTFEEIYNYYSNEVKDVNKQVSLLTYKARFCWFYKSVGVDKLKEICAIVYSLTKDRLINAEVKTYLGALIQSEKPDESITILKECLNIFQNDSKGVQNSRDLRLAYINYYLGLALRRFKQEFFKQALGYFIDARKIFSSVLGENHFEVASQDDNIANIYDDLGEFEKALISHEKVFKRKIESAIINPLSIAITLYNFSITSMSLKRFYQASVALETSLKILDHFNKIYEYANTLKYYLQLINFFIYDAKPEKNLALNSLNYVAKGIDEKSVSSDQLRNEVSWNKEWNDLCNSNDKDLDYYNQLLILFQKIYGADHPEVANCYRRLGLVSKNLGNLTEAKEFYYKALCIIDKINGYVKTKNYEKLKKEITQVSSELESQRLLAIQNERMYTSITAAISGGLGFFITNSKEGFAMGAFIGVGAKYLISACCSRKP